MSARTLHGLAQRAGRVRLRANVAARHVDDVFWVVGAGLIAGGAALERLSAGLIVAGVLVLLLAVGGSRAR